MPDTATEKIYFPERAAAGDFRLHPTRYQTKNAWREDRIAARAML
jgi:hypothetical protein